MALQLQCSFSLPSSTHQPASLRKPVFGTVMLRKTLLPIKKLPKFAIRSSARDQVFEDHSTGIICYKDDRGELICEGLDEGPRLHLQYPTSLPMRDDGSMLDLLQQRWLEIMGNGAAANHGTLLGKLSCDGSNSLY